jgi:hypothetical protein
MSVQTIPGYTYGTAEAARSPVSMEEFADLQKATMFTEEDVRYLRMAGEVLADQVEDILDLWYGWVGSQPHLVYYFSGPDGQPDMNYLQAVRRRFGQWILDTCNRPYDRDWLNYQHEIGLRHHRAKKNQTDGVRSVPHIPMRYLVAFIYPITATIKPFLTKKGHSPEDVEKMHQAWTKSVIMQVALWCHPLGLTQFPAYSGRGLGFLARGQRTGHRGRPPTPAPRAQALEEFHPPAGDVHRRRRVTAHPRPAGARPNGSP